MQVAELLDIIEEINKLKEEIKHNRSVLYQVFGEEVREEYRKKIEKLQEVLNGLLCIEL